MCNLTTNQVTWLLRFQKQAALNCVNIARTLWSLACNWPPSCKELRLYLLFVLFWLPSASQGFYLVYVLFLKWSRSLGTWRTLGCFLVNNNMGFFTKLQFHGMRKDCKNEGFSVAFSVGVWLLPQGTGGTS